MFLFYLNKRGNCIIENQKDYIKTYVRDNNHIHK